MCLRDSALSTDGYVKLICCGIAFVVGGSNVIFVIVINQIS